MPLPRPLCRPRIPLRFARPRLEAFEDRLAPAVFLVNNVLSGSVGAGAAGSLAYCIEQANALPGADDILFDSRVFLPGGSTGVSLTSALPTITDSVSIVGSVALFRTTVARAAGAPDFRIFEISGGISVTLGGLDIANGSAVNGGGIFNAGDLFVTESTIRDNVATGGNTGGGGIFSTGTITLERTHLRNNRATAADGVGGGLFLFDTGGFFVNTTFEGNTAAFGGGLLVESAANAVTLDTVNTTFSGNAATFGGGAIHTLANGGTIDLFLTHATLANNTAGGPGGGALFNFGRNNALSFVFLQNALLAGNSGPSLSNFTAPDFTGQINSLGNNLADVSTGFLNQPTDLDGAQARIGPLRDNGTMFPTHALLPGSQALDAGTFVSDFPNDVRGVSRPQGGGVDIGAVEMEPFQTALSGDGQSADVNTTFASPVGLQLTEGGTNFLPGAQVAFTLLTNGGATFAGGGLTFVATTDTMGNAVSPAVIAGASPELVEVRAMLADGTTRSAFLTVTVPPNQSPSNLQITAAPDPVAEGQVFTVSGSFDDAEPGEQHFVFIVWDDGTFTELTLAAGVFSFTATHVYVGPLSSEPQIGLTVFVQVSDEAEQSDSTFTSVTVVNAAPAVSAGDDEFVNAGALFARAGSFSDSEVDPGQGGGREGEGEGPVVSFTATVDYGDGSGEQPLALTPDRRFTLSHVYGDEGSFEVFVRVTDSRGAVGVATFTADVLLPGIPTAPAEKAVAAPGQTVTISTLGVTATLVRAAGGPAEAAIIVAFVPSAVAGGLDAAFTSGNPNLITAAYDVRTVNIGPGDRAVVKFQYANDDFDMPVLTYYEKSARQQRLVPPGQYVVDRFARTITLVLDATTTPRLQDLGGTVFTISVPVGVAPFDPTPLAALLGLGPDGSSELAVALLGDATVLANTTVQSRLVMSDGTASPSGEGEPSPAASEGGESSAAAGELPPVASQLLGLQAATATASFPDALPPPPETKGDEPAPESSQPAAAGEGEMEEEAEAESLVLSVRRDDLTEERDEVFATLGPTAATPGELLLVACALLNLPRHLDARRQGGE